MKIAESLNMYPELRIKTTREITVEWILKYQRSFTTVRSYLLDMMQRDYKATGQCRLYLAKEPWDIARTAFMLQKNSPLTPVFNRQ